MARPEGNFWLAIFDPDGAGSAAFPWHPVLQMDGMVEMLDTYFKTQQACEEYIRDEIIGAQVRFETIPDAPH